MEKLLALLVEYPGIHVEIFSNTDRFGTDYHIAIYRVDRRNFCYTIGLLKDKEVSEQEWQELVSTLIERLRYYLNRVLHTFPPEKNLGSNP